MSTSRPPLAATVLLLRDVAGALEVFMVVRHHQIDSAAGAMVFPGGKVDESDRPPHVGDVVSEASDLTDEDVAVRIAAIGDAFEESGCCSRGARGPRKSSPRRVRQGRIARA